MTRAAFVVAAASALVGGGALAYVAGRSYHASDFEMRARLGPGGAAETVALYAGAAVSVWLSLKALDEAVGAVGSQPLALATAAGIGLAALRR